MNQTTEPKLLIVTPSGQPFRWRRGKYLLRDGDFVLVGQSEEYAPDFDRLCEVLADLREEEIPWFFRRYGPLGIRGYFLKTGAWEAYLRSEGEEPSRVAWEKKFGLLLDQPRIPDGGGWTLFPYDDEDGYWRAYKEPQYLVKLALAEYRRAAKAVIRGEKDFALKLRFEYVNGVLACPAWSLLEGVIATLIWNVTHGKGFRVCVGKERYQCLACEYHKMYFWPNRARHIIGNTSRCKASQKHRAKDYREGKTTKTPQRNRQKREEALEMYRQGKKASEITAALGVSLDVFQKWLASASRKTKRKARRY